MRREIENWWKQAKYDLDCAKDNFKIKRYNLVAFLCQQAIEKGLKALVQFKERLSYIETHSLIYLGKKVKIPPKYYNFLRRISPQYILTRYPDATEDVPYELYDEEIAKKFLKETEEVIKWIKIQLE